MPEATRLEALRPWVERSQRPLVLTHRRPDGDALGAVAGVALALEQIGLQPTCMLFERPFSPRYPFLERGVAWQYWSEGGPEIARRGDAVIIVDTCAWSQLEPVAEFLRAAPQTLVIDHHPTRDAIATRPGDLRICDTSAAATCLLIAEWLQIAGLKTTPAIAEALFTGLATDCGWFRFSNTDARALRAAAALCTAGASPNALYRPIYERDPAAKLRLIGRLLLSLELHAGGLIAVLKLRQRDFAETGADRTMTEDLVNEAGRLEGAEATLLFTEEDAGVVRVNLRSKSRLDVSRLAAQFGGGGHARAAGARVTGPFDDVVARVLSAAHAALATSENA
jgi:phosphoesterase RecJ-like protein